MRMLVMGAGAVGSVVGGFMAKNGHDVTLIGREEHINAIREKGLRIRGIWGEHRVTNNLHPHTDLSGVEGTFDLVLMAVKTYDTEPATRAVQPFVGENTLVCSYQNGLGNAEVIASIVGEEHMLDARVIYGVWLPEPGVADVTVTADATAIGSYNGAVPDDRVRDVAEAMDASGIPSHATDAIATFLWAKVAYNCALNPLSALLDVPYGALLETEDTRDTMRDIIEELYAVGHAMNVPLDPPTAEGYIERLFEYLIPVTAKHYASTREDMRRGKRTEIDALNGAIVRYGEEHGVPCPANRLLTRLVHAREYQYLK